MLKTYRNVPSKPLSLQVLFLLNLVCLFFILLRLFSCTTTTNAQQNTQNDPVNYVNPFIGTQRMGHTFPGATVPFGMVQLSPDTDTVTYEKKREIQS